MDKVKRSDGQQMVEVEAAVRGRRRQIQNNRIHALVISLMILATGFFWYITPQPMSKGHHAAEDKDRKLSPNKLFSWRGPGGSGVAEALITGRNLQTIVDADIDFLAEKLGEHDSLYFDIIGFDPRGVNNTTPQFSCFPSLLSKVNFGLQAEADGILGSSADSLMRNWQRAAALSQSCSEVLLARDDNDATGEALGEHLNTVPVARDLLEIIERHAEWREKEGIKKQQEEDMVTGYDAEQKIAVRTRWNRGQEKLLYWGRSYGTVLGATFATMFPDRVSRTLLDGVVDTDDYYDGGGESSITDADAIFDRFFHYCDAAGPEKCPFYLKGGPSQIRLAYDAIESSLRVKSIPVAASSNHGPEVITCEDSSSQAILCSDAIYTNTFDLDEFQRVWNGLAADSKSIGDYWASIYLTCVGWKPRAQWRLNGPYTGNTSHPLMLVSTTLDPVTPLKSAKKMSSQFNGSVVLEQSSEGHTTGSGPSVCSAKAIRKYFQTGQLPEPGTICSSDFEPLVGTPQGTALLHGMSASDRRLYEALLQDTLTFGFAAALVS
ncbi:hypothetical protein TCE0_022f06931 [Talaromyces pinophilus]|uniref:Peptidase S33 tripeptidyl aminopeptidase-like C-terminal domain-containing protein n=1 Tax=Talaromyces pinophilus TaxID=128442 RepID=A0A6V8H7P6_TALPI|nr:hypothetical protein TCE0_022f06931 [Talaromyces pinophilus]